MATSKKSAKKSQKKPAAKPAKKGAAKAFSAKKAMTHVFTAGIGAGLVRLRRSGTARQGLRAFVEGTTVQWGPDDISIGIPMASGIHVVGVAVTGSSGNWVIRAISPPGATGGTKGTLPLKNQGVFNLLVP